MNALKQQQSRHWPRHIQTVSWIILIQLALFCPIACIAHCWWWGMQSQTGAAAEHSMLVCDLHAQHSDSAPQPMPPLPDGLAAVYPMVLLLLANWMLTPRSWRCLGQAQRVWPSYHPQISTPPPRILVLG